MTKKKNKTKEQINNAFIYSGISHQLHSPILYSGKRSPVLLLC